MSNEKATRARSQTTGIRKRHTRSCGSRAGSRCRCPGGWEAAVYSARDRRKIRKAFPTAAAARAWAATARRELSLGTMRAPADRTFGDAADDWVARARAGTIRTRSGDVYKPSTIRGYEQSVRLHLRKPLGAKKLAAITHGDLQSIAERLAGDRDASTVRNAMNAARVIFKRELALGALGVNPATGLTLPAVRGTRDRAADPVEADALLNALAAEDRALWATALYAGLRLGELAALRWQDVDLAAGVIRVERSFDPKAAVYVDPKSRAGRRTVPIAGVLRDHLLAARANRPDDDREALVFGKNGTPFDADRARRSAHRTWKTAGLDPLGFHEARHTYASLMIAAGVNAKALSTFMGHANISITLDRYGHLMPGAEAEAAGLLDAYLDRTRADTRAAAPEYHALVR